jgi:hypothetical protein
MLLGEYGLKVMPISTVYRWMRGLRLKYEVRNKGFFVDSHEKPAMLEYRKQFIRHYMANERRAHHWMQLTIKESEEMGKRSLYQKTVGTAMY